MVTLNITSKEIAMAMKIPTQKNTTSLTDEDFETLIESFHEIIIQYIHDIKMRSVSRSWTHIALIEPDYPDREVTCDNKGHGVVFDEIEVLVNWEWEDKDEQINTWTYVLTITNIDDNMIHLG
jgi:hypothetical protein